MKDIRKWFIFTEYGNNAKHLELDLSNEDVKDDEIAMCVDAQLYSHPAPFTHIGDKK